MDTCRSNRHVAFSRERRAGVDAMSKIEVRSDGVYFNGEEPAELAEVSEDDRFCKRFLYALAGAAALLLAIGCALI